MLDAWGGIAANILAIPLLSLELPSQVQVSHPAAPGRTFVPRGAAKTPETSTSEMESLEDPSKCHHRVHFPISFMLLLLLSAIPHGNQQLHGSLPSCTVLAPGLHAQTQQQKHAEGTELLRPLLALQLITVGPLAAHLLGNYPQVTAVPLAVRKPHQ